MELLDIVNSKNVIKVDSIDDTMNDSNLVTCEMNCDNGDFCWLYLYNIEDLYVIRMVNVWKELSVSDSRDYIEEESYYIIKNTNDVAKLIDEMVEYERKGDKNLFK